MHENPPAAVVPDSTRVFPEPISADECEWVLELAARLDGRWKAPQALTAHLEAIAGVLANGETAAFDPAGLADLAVFEAEPVVAVIVPDEVPEPVVAVSVTEEIQEPVVAAPIVVEIPVIAERPVEIVASEPGIVAAAAAPIEAAIEPVVADLGSVPTAAPLFPRGVSSQQQRRKRGRTSRRDESANEASLQMALPLESDAGPRVAVSHFAERMLRARERLATDEPTTSMGASAEVLSFADRLKKIRERLAGEESGSGQALA